MDKPSVPAGDTAATKPNGDGRAVAMTKDQLSKPVSYRSLRNIFDELDLLGRIVALERACGLSPTAPTPGVEAVAPVVKNFVDAQLGPLRGMVHELRADAMKYMGVYEQGRTYQRGEVVSLKGGMWFALETTNTRPGVNGDWKLTVKSGQA